MVPTIRDVAQRAEVSISTVSRVLNNSAAVDVGKRRRVEAAADELGYRPNLAARSLLGQKSGGIGVLLPYIAGDFFQTFLQGIDRTTSDTGYFLNVSSSHRNIQEFQAVIQGMNHWVDGLIVMSTQIPAERVRAWLPESLPVVFVNTQAETAENEVINFDNRSGMRAVTEHLIHLGHRQIGFLTGPDGAYDGLERRDGYRAALQDHGIEPRPGLEFTGDYTMETGEAVVPAVLAASPRPTAMVAANDISAYGLIRGLSAAGLSVPDDLSVAGFDDILLAQFSAPALTTVRAPLVEMGQRAIERLLARIEGEPWSETEPVVLPTQLIARDSTAPLSDPR